MIIKSYNTHQKHNQIKCIYGLPITATRDVPCSRGCGITGQWIPATVTSLMISNFSIVGPTIDSQSLCCYAQLSVTTLIFLRLH